MLQSSGITFLQLLLQDCAVISATWYRLEETDFPIASLHPKPVPIVPLGTLVGGQRFFPRAVRSKPEREDDILPAELDLELSPLSDGEGDAQEGESTASEAGGKMMEAAVLVVWPS